MLGLEQIAVEHEVSFNSIRDLQKNSANIEIKKYQCNFQFYKRSSV